LYFCGGRVTLVSEPISVRLARRRDYAKEYFISRPILDDWIAQKISGRYPPPYGELQFSNFPREELERWQLESIKRTLAHAVQNSSFYRSLFGNKELGSLSEMAGLPFTTPDDLRDDPYRMVCVHPNNISRIVTLKTSGSTGASKRIFFSDADIELCTDYFRHGMRNLVDSTDIIGILFPHRTPASVGDQLIRGLWRLGAETVPLFGLTDDEISSLIGFKKITSLAGTPKQVSGLAENYPQHTSIRTVLLSADYVSDEVRSTIRRAWGCEIFEHYGMTEMGLGCAVSCEKQNGYHVREADLYLEIIDPETGETVPDGEWGEIVFTTLTRVGMPFIRYRTGDFSCWKAESCSCGSGLKLLDYIRDRQVEKGQANY
jgi:phenylacetate-coenzyme A ligase PaaK-like adenylate-forming protein